MKKAAKRVTSSKTCSVCGRSLPTTHFSTLARWQGGGIESTHCTTCSWLTLVTHRVSYEMDGDRAEIVMRPREQLENLDLMYHVHENIADWMRDKKVVERYGSLGPIQAQAEPYYEFHSKLKARQVSRTAFPFGGVHEPFEAG